MSDNSGVSLRRVFFGTCIVLATLVGAYVLYRLGSLIVILFISLIFASTVRPLSETLQRWRIPGSVSIALVYGAAIIGVVLLLVLALPPVIQLAMQMSQGNQLVSDLNFALIKTSFFINQQFELYVPILQLPQQLKDALSSADEAVAEQAVPFALNAISVTGQIVLAIVLSVYWLVARRSALPKFLMWLPKPYREPVYRVWVDTEDSLGRYLRGQVVLALIIGAVSYVGLLVLQVPNARALAVLAGLFEFIPFVGPVLAAVPAFLMALNVGPVTAILVILFYTLVQFAEGNFLVPQIMGRGLSLHPMIVLLAITAGFTLAGVVGAILALPLAGAAQIAVRNLRRFSSTQDGDVAEPDSGGQVAATQDT